MIRDAGIVKQKARVPSAPIISRPKSIKKKTKAAALPESALKRSLDKASHSSDSDVPKLKDIVPQDQQRNRRRDSAGSALVALGGGIFDVLVTYGEKLRDSLGYILYSILIFGSGLINSLDSQAQLNQQGVLREVLQPIRRRILLPRSPVAHHPAN